MSYHNSYGSKSWGWKKHHARHRHGHQNNSHNSEPTVSIQPGGVSSFYQQNVTHCKDKKVLSLNGPVPDYPAPTKLKRPWENETEQIVGRELPLDKLIKSVDSLSSTDGTIPANQLKTPAVTITTQNLIATSTVTVPDVSGIPSASAIMPNPNRSPVTAVCPCNDIPGPTSNVSTSVSKRSQPLESSKCPQSSLSCQTQHEHLALMASFHKMAQGSYMDQMWLVNIKHSYISQLESWRQIEVPKSVPHSVDSSFSKQWLQLIMNTRQSLLNLNPKPQHHNEQVTNMEKKKDLQPLDMTMAAKANEMTTDHEGTSTFQTKETGEMLSFKVTKKLENSGEMSSQLLLSYKVRKQEKSNETLYLEVAEQEEKTVEMSSDLESTKQKEPACEIILCSAKKLLMKQTSQNSLKALGEASTQNTNEISYCFNEIQEDKVKELSKYKKASNKSMADISEISSSAGTRYFHEDPGEMTLYLQENNSQVESTREILSLESTVDSNTKTDNRNAFDSSRPQGNDVYTGRSDFNQGLREQLLAFENEAGRKDEEDEKTFNSNGDECPVDQGYSSMVASPCAIVQPWLPQALLERADDTDQQQVLEGNTSWCDDDQRDIDVESIAEDDYLPSRRSSSASIRSSFACCSVADNMNEFQSFQSSVSSFGLSSETPPSVGLSAFPLTPSQSVSGVPKPDCVQTSDSIVRSRSQYSRSKAETGTLSSLPGNLCANLMTVSSESYADVPPVLKLYQESSASASECCLSSDISSNPYVRSLSSHSSFNTIGSFGVQNKSLPTSSLPLQHEPFPFYPPVTSLPLPPFPYMNPIPPFIPSSPQFFSGPSLPQPPSGSYLHFSSDSASYARATAIRPQSLHGIPAAAAAASSFYLLTPPLTSLHPLPSAVPAASPFLPPARPQRQLGSGKSKYFNPMSRIVLEQWYQEHMDSPYASALQVAQLAAMSDLSNSQVKKWLSNRRYRTSNSNNVVAAGGGERRGSGDSTHSEAGVSAMWRRHQRSASWQL